MNLDEQLKQLAFDFYQRYILLRPIGELFRPQGEKYRVLDVGGHTPPFWSGFPSMAGVIIQDAHIIVADVQPDAELRNYTQASGLQLPFADESFDLVCSLDTLEHTPAESRRAFVSELLRVTRDGLYLAFPQDSPSNRWAETLVREFADVVLKDPIPALLEHQQFGLPERQAVADELMATGYPYIDFDQGNTDVWLLMMLTYHSLRQASNEFVAELNERFNRAFASQDWLPPAYRVGYILSKKRTMAELEGLRDSFRVPAGGAKLDLNGVLALCQLFLQLAHQGQIAVDKDRHIRNIEADLALAQDRSRVLAQEISELQGKLEIQTEGVALFEAQVQDKDRHIQNIEAELALAQNRSGMLKQELSELQVKLEIQVQNATLFESQVQDKDRHIRNIEAELETQTQSAALLQSQVQDKDRHIRNIEAELASLQDRSKNLVQASAQLQGKLEIQTQRVAFLEAQSRELNAVREQLAGNTQYLQMLLAAAETEVKHLREQLQEQHVVNAVSAVVAAQERGFAELQQGITMIEDRQADRDRERSKAMEQGISGIRGELIGLKQQYELESGTHQKQEQSIFELRSVIAELQRTVAENQQQVHAIYQSRIWRMLQSLGGVLLRLLLRRSQDSTVPAEDMKLYCDFPLANQNIPWGDVVAIQGWAAADSAIRTVTVQIDEGQPVQAIYGQERPDVAKEDLRFPGIQHCGYELHTAISNLPGPHQITIQAVSKKGNTAQIRIALNLTPRTRDLETILTCDSPDTAALTPVRGLVEIRGWAVDQFGISTVQVEIDGGPPVEAKYGLRRLDVGKQFSDYPNSLYAGYRYLWDTDGLAEGTHHLVIRARTVDGLTRERQCEVFIDPLWTYVYNIWIARNEPDAEEKKRIAQDVSTLALLPVISIVVPVYKTPLELLERCIASVRSQIYPQWELCLADDGSEVPEITKLLEHHAAEGRRIQFTSLKTNQGISGATNAALSLAGGEYIAFLDHDDELADFALAEVIRAINRYPDVDLFYSDEDKIDATGRRYEPFFKPDWSPDLFLSCNYLCHFIVCKRWVVDHVGGLDERYRYGSQDYDFLLRVIECTQNIKRIPKVLYHWRAIPGSTARASGEKPKAGEEGLRAILGHLKKTHPEASVEQILPCRYRVRYPVDTSQKVTIIMPSGGNPEYLVPALEDVLGKTSYPAFDVLLVDNSKSDQVREVFTRHRDQPRLRYLDRRNQPFNFSRLNNDAVRHTDVPLILFLNDDITVIDKDWLTAMVEHAQRPEVGAVGALLLYPDGLIQHAGVTLGIYNNSGHLFKGLPPKPGIHFDLPSLVRNTSAVTAACLLLRRAVFWEVGGFDEENLAVAFQDVDLCLKIHTKGYRIVYTPFARLCHHESVTKEEKVPNPTEVLYMQAAWSAYIANDPYYNPNLTRVDEHYNLCVT